MLKKSILLTGVMVGLITLLGTVSADAAWRKNNIGWWYTEGNSWVTGWKNIDSKWYYFDNNGYMKVGWLLDGHKWYYLEPDNGMVTSNIYINGKLYKFDNNGQWLENPNTVNNNSGTLSEDKFNELVCDEMHKLVNEHRQKNGVEQLKIDKNLDNSAYLKSKHMVDNNYFAHNYKEKDFRGLIYELSGNEINGENIAQNYLKGSELTEESAKDLANRLFIQWKNSSGHNENMLRKSFNRFGFGIKIGQNNYVYATQHFAL